MKRVILLMSFAALLAVGSGTAASFAGGAQASPVALSTVPAGQVVIYSNLGPGGSFDPWSSWCVYVHPFPPANPALCPPSPQAVAMALAAGNGGRVTQIDLGLTWEGHPTNTATVQLATDTGYPNPGQALLGSWQVADQPLIYDCPCGLTTVDVSPAIPVEAGRRYWVIVRPGTDNTVDIWNYTYNSAHGLVATYPDWRGGGPLARGYAVERLRRDRLPKTVQGRLGAVPLTGQDRR